MNPRGVRPRQHPHAPRPRLAWILAVALMLGAGAPAGAPAVAAEGGRAVWGVADGAGSGPGSPGTSASADTVPDTDFWVDPNSAAARQAAEWRSQGRTDDARLIERIADRPQGVWLYGPSPGPTVRAATVAATAERRTAVLVAYFIPHRDCGDYSEGGAASAAEYRQWVDEFAEGIGDRAAYVIVEPDAIAQGVSGCAKADTYERYGLLAYAVNRIKARPHARVYLDAGNSSWIPAVSRLVAPLREAGIARADGFALNVSNYQTNEVTSEYGNQLSAALGGGEHFVVDSSRNGNGPYAGDGVQPWCNPPGRALGTPPTTRTGAPALDAYLWIKRPGESDGTCRGGPRAGQWWPEYALGLASRAKG
ncbi:glycoside hydrolase family 6 protein [Streptomyces sp. NPDC048436]|uniref:glycoside hydrolase family 6 protein n=1 Tax=Streptomyces sp. NPDC048436 TaxID=3365550 RepID=UPI00371C9FB1